MAGARLSSVVVLVPDYASGIAFFTDILGFSLLEDTDLGGGKRWVRVGPPGGGSDILLARASDGRQQAAIGQQTGGRVGFFLHTDDFARDHALWHARGLQFLEEPRHEAYGMVAQFADPWGNRWDLIGP